MQKTILKTMRKTGLGHAEARPLQKTILKTGETMKKHAKPMQKTSLQKETALPWSGNQLHGMRSPMTSASRFHGGQRGMLGNLESEL